MTPTKPHSASMDPHTETRHEETCSPDVAVPGFVNDVAARGKDLLSCASFVLQLRERYRV